MDWSNVVGGAMSFLSSITGLLSRKSSSSSSVSSGYNTDDAKRILGNITLNGWDSSWSNIGNWLYNLGNDIGYYANSAFDYYMADRAFEKQVAYNNATMDKQFEYDKHMQDRSFVQSTALQDWQNSWSKMMSDTSHQREVADLRAAGLNPILSANSGANAYTSGSAVVSGNTPSALGVQQPDYSGAGSRAVQRAQLKQQQKLVDAQSSNAFAQSLLSMANVGLTKSQQGRLDTQNMVDLGNLSLAEKRNNAETAKLYAEANKINSEALHLIPVMYENYKASTGSHNANTKYTNERSRGYGIGEGPVNSFLNLFKLIDPNARNPWYNFN